MKATALLKKDHAAVKKLLAEFSRTTARAPRRRQALIDKIAQELEIHSTIEEELFYPAVKNVSGGERLIDEAVQKVKELRDAVVHHATEEEGQMFPVAEKGLGQQLMELGEQMAVRKK